MLELLVSKLATSDREAVTYFERSLPSRMLRSPCRSILEPEISFSSHEAQGLNFALLRVASKLSNSSQRRPRGDRPEISAIRHVRATPDSRMVLIVIVQVPRRTNAFPSYSRSNLTIILRS